MKNRSYRSGLSRRDFFWTVGATAAGVSMASGTSAGTAPIVTERMMKKKKPTVMGAFLYPPSEILNKEGYFSWPGAHFDAESRQKQRSRSDAYSTLTRSSTQPAFLAMN